MPSEIENRPSPPTATFEEKSIASSISSDEEPIPESKAKLPNFKAPPFEVFSQAPSTHGPLDAVQSVGMSENEIEEITPEEFYANVSASIAAVNARASVPGQHPKFYTLMKEAASVLQESFESESHTISDVFSGM
jgi:hypothetical protein